MRRLLTILSWLLLLGSTVVIGVISLRLLRFEEDRLARSAQTAAEAKVGLMAENIDLAVREVQGELLDRLSTIPASERTAVLREWERNHPLVRNVFEIDADDRIRLPTEPMTREEKGFLQRFETLFSGRSPWPAPAKESTREPRQRLRDLARKRTASAIASNASRPAGGWIPWFREGDLYLLGWVADENAGGRYGVELETIALFSRLVQYVPQRHGKNEAMALIDGHGRIFHQEGGFEVTADMRPAISLAVGNALPHWRAALFSEGPLLATGSYISKLSTLMVLTFLAAILLGGSLLLWQAGLHRREAQRKTTFVSNVSHELKTPLTTIRMYAELLGEGRVKGEATRRDYLDVIIRESHRLTRLVNNVLDFSRLDQKRKIYRKQRIDLKELLAEIMEQQSPRLHAEGLTLSLSMPEEDCEAETDRDAMEQTLLNLIDNAIKYAADGETLDVEVLNSDRGPRILVMDRGPGIPHAHRDRIFDTFHRVDDSLTAETPGSGLGLSIARQMMRDLGGDLTYESRADGGSVFTVHLGQA